jgi:hypothetical protein
LSVKSQCEAGDVVRGAGVEHIDDVAVHGDADRHGSAGGLDIEELKSVREHKKHRHIVAARVHHEQPSIIPAQRHGALIAQPGARSVTAGSHFANGSQQPISGPVVDHDRIRSGVGHRVDGAGRTERRSCTEEDELA